ncbi:DUF4355 domain-containing protein [Thermosediminibacter oceani]|uniref:DUF4355 domain-containing protein n=1 Tax=Thermosediminibacter oceani (strain ATCC BAA-1034 / DSM 16646 / JW/IW-1228P) TaxID=555079 RepID=D9S3R0_THEOJ|nr:DUF4355 domain-containing protein [Thermosediminibacter oceani]ADL08037.1 conserved hypothetical protein [Thermosediminibacter oceani DSM 16646]
MTLEEVKAFLEANQDKDEVKSFISGFITLEKVKSLVNENPEFKSWFDSERDKHLQKGLEKWKSNNLQKLIDEEIKRRYPEKDEKDIEIAKLRAEFEKMKAEALRKDLTNKALKIAQERGLPTEIIDFFVGEDERTTTDNLMKLERVFNEAVNNIVQQRLKGTYQPPKETETQTRVFTKDDLKNMTEEEINKYWGKFKIQY